MFKSQLLCRRLLVSALKNRISGARLKILVLTLTLIMMFATTSSHAARVTLTIHGGPLGFSSSSPTLSPVEITGLDQITTGKLGLFDIKDARGTGAGWQITAQATDFVSRADPGHIIKAAGLTISEPPSVIVIAGNNPPQSSSGPLDAPLKFLSSPVNGGMGRYRTEPKVSLDIPADTFSGIYDSTLTTTLISGP